MNMTSMDDGFVSDESDFVGTTSMKQRFEQTAQQTSNAELLEKWKTSQKLDLVAQMPASQKLPLSRLENPLEGRPEARQLSESASDFLRRCPPLSSADLGPWIWVYDPNPDAKLLKGGKTPSKTSKDEAGGFTDQCEALLTSYMQEEDRIQSEMQGKAKGTITRKLTPMRAELRKNLLRVAKEEGVLNGKWMLFPTAEEIPHTWKTVVEAVIEGRLGIGAKIATQASGADQRVLICCYTKDWSDEDDVRRVLKELVDLGLCPRQGNGIYYKCDAFTHLEIESHNKYGLKASMYSSRDMLK